MSLSKKYQQEKNIFFFLWTVETVNLDFAWVCIPVPVPALWKFKFFSYFHNDLIPWYFSSPHFPSLPSGKKEAQSGLAWCCICAVCCWLCLYLSGTAWPSQKPQKNNEFMWSFFFFSSVRSLIQFTFAYHFTDFHKTSWTILPVRLLSLSSVAKIDLLVPNLLETGQCACKSLRNHGEKKAMGDNLNYLLPVL